MSYTLHSALDSTHSRIQWSVAGFGVTTQTPSQDTALPFRNQKLLNCHQLPGFYSFLAGRSGEGLVLTVSSKKLPVIEPSCCY